MQLGYCTNVHAGVDLAQTRANLETYALPVKRRFRPDADLGIGLWLAASAARQMIEVSRGQEWAAWLRQVGLVPFTLNGFPFGDFHRPVVKHDVYLPTWWEPARLEYTSRLITILDQLLAPGSVGSISTLPIAWNNPPPAADRLAAAAANLARCAEKLRRLEQETGRFICLCVEPEPGCVLQRSTDVVRFFEEHLLPGRDEALIRRYLAVCHDVCHAVVMFEEQDEVLRRYRAAGIGVGKVQVSSAVVLPLDRLPVQERPLAIRQLADFAEDRYLHQTMVQIAPGVEPVFFEDLPQALAAAGQGPLAGEWRVHFHVPIYLERFGKLEASRQAILACLQAMQQQGGPDHYEVETYAWGVLPAELRQPDLAAGIAAELAWFQSIL